MQRYKPKRPDADRRLITEMRRMVESHPRYGSERVHQLLLGTGWKVNFKRVHRLWKIEHMQVPKKQRRRRRLPASARTVAFATRPSTEIMFGAMIFWLIGLKMADSLSY
jgi:transposase InsO family protein